jgi:CubicO group peptidase (beta-lactamase class C family)
MSLADYGRFVAAFMGGAPGWLSAGSLSRLTTPPAGSPPAYACGWGVREQPWGGVGGPGPVLGHDGSNTMWHCTVALAPQRKRAVIVMANDGPTGRAACQSMSSKLVPLVFAPST